MKQLSRLFVLFAIMLTSVIVFAPVVHAEEECEHETNSWVTYAKEYSNTKHKIVKFYSCNKCDEIVEEVLSYENHKFDKYHTCTKCNDSVARNITLASNKTAYVNEKSWIKINIKQKGYIQVTTKGKGNAVYTDSGEVVNPDWALYNNKKAVYLDSQNVDSKGYAPVKKGTYYIKVEDDCSIKYTFKKDPSKKNYTMKKAVKLAKNKKATTVIYPSDKKNTWTRYYKITLSKPQKIRFNISGGYGNLVDNKGYWIPNGGEYTKDGAFKNNITEKKLKKGTYYLVVESHYSTSKNRYAGEVCTVSWK